jgi:predicted amidophosphoribosyltransferase
MSLHKRVADLIDLVLPATCVSCGRPAEWWCRRCRPPPRVITVPLAGLTVVASAEYTGALRQALLAYKERGRHVLGPALTEYLGYAVAGNGAGCPAIVVVPSRSGAARERGGDHVWRLAKAVAASQGLRAFRPLRLVGPVSDSAGLSAAERAANLAHRMSACQPPEPDLAAVLVDDIVTSGATLFEAQRALTAAGWSVDRAAVIAHTRRRFPAEPAGASTQ